MSTPTTRKLNLSREPNVIYVGRKPLNVSTIEITLSKEAKPNEEAKATQEAQAAKEKVASSQV